MKRIILFALACLLLAAWPVPCAVIERGVFRIEYHPDDAALAERSAAVLEEAISEFGHRLPVGDDPIRVVIAHTLPQFMQHATRFGDIAVSGMAKSDQGLIVVKAPHLRPVRDDYAGTLRHELVHVLLYRNTDIARLPRWLNEGIAMSLANEYRWASTLQVGRMFLRNRIIEYRNLNHAFLVPGNETEFNDAYAQALSMTRYLRNRLGEDRFWAVVMACRAMPFPEALREKGGLSVQDFWQAYHRSLWFFALIGITVSGSFFTPAAFLVIIAWFRKRQSNRRILERWAAEERESMPYETFRWDAVAEDPEAWKGDEADDDR